MTTAISHLVATPDWLLLRCQSPEQCAESIQSILKALENNERWAYAIRGEALRLFDERRLYLLFPDPSDGGRFCSCTYRWLQIYLPDSARYCQEALVSRQKLHDTIPLEIAQNITRTNLRLLEGTSESVRKLPEVQDAAQTMPAKEFRAKLNIKFNQHFEESARMVLDFENQILITAVDAALDLVAKKALDHGGPELKTREEKLSYWAVDFLREEENNESRP